MTPPETGRPYNDFLEIFNDYLKMDKRLFGETHGFDIAEALGAWVRVREAQAKRDQHHSDHGCDNTTYGAWDGYNCSILANLESALATARKQLEETK